MGNLATALKLLWETWSSQQNFEIQVDPVKSIIMECQEATFLRGTESHGAMVKNTKRVSIARVACEHDVQNVISEAVSHK